jgi:acetolactate synthase-1/2/3 large subunit
MKNTDIIAEVLHEYGIRDFFAVTGGAAVHVIDSLIEHKKMRSIFHHHEQAAALAADAYARMNGLGVCVVTTGPGVTNALTGLLCSWQDSTPTVFISGQARYGLTSLGSNVRQVGTQHLEVVPIVEHMTKKAVMVKPGDDVRKILKDLVELAQSGRKGPVWIDIPLDVQLAEFGENPESLESSQARCAQVYSDKLGENLALDLEQSVRPVLLLGRGVTGFNQKNFDKLLVETGIPCVRTWGFFDTKLTIPEHLDCGVVGVSGQRGANRIVSESDLILSVGARWGQAVVGPAIAEFAPIAKVHIVDIDEHELDRVAQSLPSIKKHFSDSRTFLEMFTRVNQKNLGSSSWNKHCQLLREWNLEQNFGWNDNKIDQYNLFKVINQKLGANSTIVIDGGGTVVYCSMQILELLPKRRVLIPSASAPMGTGLPHSIGAQIASPGNVTMMICGDGSLPFNIQELQTLITNQLSVKIIVVNNNGYLSIQGTQDQFLGGRQHGSSKLGGLEIPNFQKICNAFGIPHFSVNQNSELQASIDSLLSCQGPALLEVFIQENQEIYPRTSFSKDTKGVFKALPLSHMHPDVELPSFIDVAQR